MANEEMVVWLYVCARSYTGVQHPQLLAHRSIREISPGCIWS